MLCSISTKKTGSSWLNRLRTAKGFPDDESTDLDNFLQNPNSPNPKSSDSSPNSHANVDQNRNEDKKLFNAMSSVLNELFNFGDNRGIRSNFKKSGRKQGNPRICAFANNSFDENNNAVLVEKATALRSGDNNSGVEGVKELDERENGDGSLSGFSRTEVTVIDTSYECWKFDKLLYRKKNVWKVRDKKGKSESVGRKKKRKVSDEEDRGGGKKRKVGEAEGSRKQCEFLLNEDYDQAPEKTPNKVSNVLKKKQGDMKLDSGNSSVILIKSISTSRKNGAAISKSCLKSQNKP